MRKDKKELVTLAVISVIVFIVTNDFAMFLLILIIGMFIIDDDS